MATRGSSVTLNESLGAHEGPSVVVSPRAHALLHQTDTIESSTHSWTGIKKRCDACSRFWRVKLGVLTSIPWPETVRGSWEATATSPTTTERGRMADVCQPSGLNGGSCVGTGKDNPKRGFLFCSEIAQVANIFVPGCAKFPIFLSWHDGHGRDGRRCDGDCGCPRRGRCCSPRTSPRCSPSSTRRRARDHHVRHANPWDLCLFADTFLLPSLVFACGRE